MASVIVILECVDNKKKSTPCIVLYEEHKWNEGTVYNCPGGNVDKGETHKMAAMRETMEEAFLSVPENMLTNKNRIIIDKVYFWVIKLNKIDRESFIKARFCTPGLKRYQKETHDLIKVPIMSLKKSCNMKDRYVTDLGGRKIKLRRSFYNCLTKDPRLLEKIEDVFKHHAC